MLAGVQFIFRSPLFMANTQPASNTRKFSDDNLCTFIRANSNHSITKTKTLLKPEAFPTAVAPSSSTEKKGYFQVPVTHRQSFCPWNLY